jgi:hypothetical protein
MQRTMNLKTPCLGGSGHARDPSSTYAAIVLAAEVSFPLGYLDLTVGLELCYGPLKYCHWHLRNQDDCPGRGDPWLWKVNHQAHAYIKGVGGGPPTLVSLSRSRCASCPLPGQLPSPCCAFSALCPFPCLRLLHSLEVASPCPSSIPRHAAFYDPYHHLPSIRAIGWSVHFEECMLASALTQDLEEDLAIMEASLVTWLVLARVKVWLARTGTLGHHLL